jgi:hypothetical protein
MHGPLFIYFLKFFSFFSFVAPTTIYVHTYFSAKKKNLGHAFLFITNNIIKKFNKYKEKYRKINARDLVFFFYA